MVETFKGPGIALQEICLLRCSVEVVDPTSKPRYHLSLISLNRAESDDGKNLNLFAGFDVAHGVEKPFLNFTCQFVARYVRPNDACLPWKDFSSAVALAHIIPYLREFVSNITGRLPAPVLMLNPINTHAMVADFEKRKGQVALPSVPVTPSP